VGTTPRTAENSIARTLTNINAAVVSGSLDTVRDGLNRYNARPATVADCCALLGVPPPTDRVGRGAELQAAYSAVAALRLG
jgi:hypothetical protein